MPRYMLRARKRRLANGAFVVAAHTVVCVQLIENVVSGSGSYRRGVVVRCSQVVRGVVAVRSLVEQWKVECCGWLQRCSGVGRVM